MALGMGRFVTLAGLYLGSSFVMVSEAAPRRGQVPDLNAIERVLNDAKERADVLELEYGVRGGLLGVMEAQQRFDEGLSDFMMSEGSDVIDNYEPAAMNFFAVYDSRALAGTGQHSESLYYLAESLYRLHNHDLALLYYETLAADESSFFLDKAVGRQLEIHALNKDLDQFQKVYNAYVRSQKVPSTDELEYKLGKSFYFMQQRDLAKRAFQKIAADNAHSSEHVCDRAERLKDQENPYLAKACYFMGVMSTFLESDLPKAEEYFGVVAQCRLEPLTNAASIEADESSTEATVESGPVRNRVVDCVGLPGQDDALKEQAVLSLARVAKERARIHREEAKEAKINQQPHDAERAMGLAAVEDLKATTYYQQVSDKSDVLDEKYYELIYTFIDQENWSKALRDVGIFLDVFDNHPAAPQLRLLKGNLYMKKGELEKAYTQYEKVVEGSNDAQALLRELRENEADLQFIFDKLVRKVPTYDPTAYCLPRYVQQNPRGGFSPRYCLSGETVEMLYATGNMETVVGLTQDVQQQDRDIDLSAQFQREVENALNVSQGSVGTFNQGRLGLTRIRDESISIQLRLLSAELEYIRNRAEVVPRNELDKIGDALSGVQSMAIEIMLKDSERFEARMAFLRERAGSEATFAQLEAEVRQLQAEKVAMETRERNAPDALTKAEQSRLTALRTLISAKQSEMDKVRQQIDQLNIQSTVGMGASENTDHQRTLLLESFKEIREALRSHQSSVSGGDAREFFGRVNIMAVNAERLDKRARAIRSKLESAEAAALSELKSRLETESNKLDDIRRELAMTTDDVDELASVVTRDGFEALESTLFEVIMDADRGVAEVFWERRSRVKREIDALKKEKTVQEQILKDRFEEIEKTLNKQMNAEIESGLGGQ